MLSCKPVDTPISKGEALSDRMCLETLTAKAQISRVPYISAVGSVMYVMLYTKRDIYFIIGLVSRYHANPGQAYWKAIKRIIRYST